MGAGRLDVNRLLSCVGIRRGATGGTRGMKNGVQDSTSHSSAPTTAARKSKTARASTASPPLTSNLHPAPCTSRACPRARSLVRRFTTNIFVHFSPVDLAQELNLTGGK